MRSPQNRNRPVDRVFRHTWLLCAVLAVFVPGAVHAQDAFFHRGAQHFLTGSNQLAKAEVERGLQQFPANENLKKFWELLNQQQDQQNQDDKDQKDKKDQKDQNKDQKDQDQQKQDKQDQQSKDKEQQQKQDSQKKDQPQQEKKPEDQQPSSGKKDQEKKEGEEAKSGQAQKPEENEGDPEGQPQQAKAIRMTPQQAVRLLETLKGEERTLQFKPVLRTNRTDRILKDW